ncbi:hypothetical protein AURDEDRAFT_115790 [Auricularia subglabra TFB-10046 SS5]|nr:hypothetical protein AURDEDRAFT_115790 [Auricularia subglabra TFB-10046 SS5]
MDLPRALSPHPTLRIVPAADPLPPTSPSPLSSSAPTPSDTLSPPPVSSASTRRSSVSSTDASSSTGLTPPASPTPTPMPAPRRQMAKLQRYLGENVPADLLLAPVSSHSSVSSSASTGTAFSIGAGSIAEAATPPRSLRRAPSASSNGPGLASRAKRRLSLELSALASFNLSARLQAAGPPPPRAPSPNPNTQQRTKAVPATLTIVQSPTSTSSRSSMSTEPATPTLPALSRTGTELSAVTRRSIEKDLKLRPRTAGMRSVREEAELDPMALVYSSSLPMPKIRPKTEKEKQKEREKEERKREKEEKKKSKKANSISVVAGASRTSFESKASLDVGGGGLRSLIRKKSFDAWSARKEHPLPPVPASMTMHARATSESIRPSTAPQASPAPAPILVPPPMREKEKPLPIANAPAPTTRERELPPTLAPMNFPSGPVPVFGSKDDNDRLGAAALRRSGSQSRSSDERPQRARSRRRKSRSMTGLPIGKLALGGYALELDPDPTWDAAQSDYETSQRRRQGRALITADVVDHSDGDVEWMWRRGARPRRGRARALEDESDDDISDNDTSIARRREMAMAALAGMSKASSEGGHSNMPPRRPPRAEWTDASSSSLGHANVSSPSVDVPPAFTDPFSRTPMPPMPTMVPPERPSPLERSKSSPTIPPRSAKRPPIAPTPVPPLPTSVPSPNNAPLPPIAPEQKGRFARFFRSGSASGGSAQGKVLRKDRERSVERKASMSLKQQQQQQQMQLQQQPVRFVPAHPLPPPPPPPPQGFVKGHTPSVSFSGSVANQSETQVEVVDSDGRKGYVPVDDVMFTLRQLRAL